MSDDTTEATARSSESADRESPEAEEGSLDISGPLPTVAARKYDPEPHRERLRGTLATGLLLLLAAMVAASFVGVWTDWMTEAEVKDLLTVIFAPVVALAGSALGFYFGGKTQN